MNSKQCLWYAVLIAIPLVGIIFILRKGGAGLTNIQDGVAEIQKMAQKIIQPSDKVEPFTNWQCDKPLQVVTNDNYYNYPNCSANGSCVMPPDNYNMFPKDLQPVIKKSNQEVECPEQIRFPQCPSTEDCNFQSPFLIDSQIPPVVTPAIPDGSHLKDLKVTCTTNPQPFYQNKEEMVGS